MIRVLHIELTKSAMRKVHSEKAEGWLFSQLGVGEVEQSVSVLTAERYGYHVFATGCFSRRVAQSFHAQEQISAESFGA